MKKLYTLFLTLFIATLSFGQPANDNCNNPELITVTNTSTNFIFDINTAVLNNETICGATTDFADVWYQFIMPLDGNIFVDGSISWNNFALYDSCGSTEIECVNTKDLFTNLTSGNTYFLRVYRTSTDASNTSYQNFSIKAFPTATNDDCTSAENISVSTTVSTVSFEVGGASVNNEIGCSGATLDYVDIWYDFTMPVNGNLYIDASINWNNIALYDGCGGTLIQCGTSNEFITGLTSGTDYKLRIFRTSADADNTYLSFSIIAYEDVTNDDCASAENIIISTTQSTVNFEIGGASINNEIGCTGTTTDYADIWYYFTMPVNGNLYVDGSIGWNNFVLYDTCNGTEIQCGTANQLFTGLIATTNYKLRVFRTLALTDNDNYRSFSIQAFEIINNDDCTSAETIVVTDSPTTINFGIAGATINNEVGCSGTTAEDYADVWYEFTMPTDGNVSIDGTLSWNNFALYDACNGNELGCFQSDGDFVGLTSGTIYKLRVFRTLVLANNDVYKSFTIQTSETLSTNNFATENSIIIYPNPTNGILNISSETTVDSILVYDILGKIVAKTFNQNYINLEHLNSGMYVVKVKSNSTIEYQRILLE
ncbi:T9SS type A sorting domain-containing protein [Psychroserpens luteus]|uniref:T9SS type A sorting domain-containing protein n=1 Tax=Psychroserpens luteus TaxID=1434066 RepID=A0ABW5ZSI3_9FLAO|nr:T9SS type A sorting domain-containing protein [Psychroserpens luteus]